MYICEDCCPKQTSCLLLLYSFIYFFIWLFLSNKILFHVIAGLPRAYRLSQWQDVRVFGQVAKKKLLCHFLIPPPLYFGYLPLKRGKRCWCDVLHNSLKNNYKIVYSHLTKPQWAGFVWVDLSTSYPAVCWVLVTVLG